MKEKVILFDGTNFDGFTRSDGSPVTWDLKDGVMTVSCGGGNIVSKYTYGDAHIHVEFNLPYMPDCFGQDRANSGVYVQGCYEVQVLDSSMNEVPNKSDCGAIYDIAAPLCNACIGADVWQTYDIILKAAKLNEDGSILENAKITVILNGKVIHNNFTLPRNTPGGVYNHVVEQGPLLLQDHGNPVSFRNIWVQPLD